MLVQIVVAFRWLRPVLKVRVVHGGDVPATGVSGVLVVSGDQRRIGWISYSLVQMLSLRLDIPLIHRVLIGETCVLLWGRMADHSLGVRQGSLRLSVLLNGLKLGYNVVQL